MYYIYDVNGTEYTKVPIEFNHVSSSKRKQESHGDNPEEPANYLTLTYKAGSPKDAINTKSGGEKYLSFGFADAMYPEYVIEYSFDNGITWNTKSGSKIYIDDFIVNTGDKILLRGTKCEGIKLGANLNSEGKFEVSGDLNSMLNGKGGIVEKDLFPFQLNWNNTVFDINASEPVYSSGNFVSPFTQISFISNIEKLLSGIPVKGKGEYFDNSQYVLQQQYPFVLQQYSEGNDGDDDGGKKSGDDLWKITINNDCEFGFWAGLDNNEDSGFTFSNVKTIHLVYDKDDQYSGKSPDVIFNELLIEASENSDDVYYDEGEPFAIASFIGLWDPETGEHYEEGDDAVITIPDTVNFKLFIEGSDNLYIKESEEAEWTQPAGSKFTPTDGMYVKMVGSK